MTFNAKWLVRAGALLVMLGFFLPTMLVSCTALGVTQSVGELSLANLAGGSQLQQSDGIIYLIFLGALVALMASLTSLIRQDLDAYLPLVEAGGIALSVLVLAAKLIQLSSNTAQTGIEIKPLFGAWILGVGYLLTIGGVFMEFVTGFRLPIVNYGRAAVPMDRGQPTPAWQQPPPPPAFSPPGMSSAARLELISGNLPTPLVYVTGADFSIGRGQSNQLNLPDPKASRTHARLRFAQGTWFIQDQNSALGVYVNGQRVQAGRINSGDQLKIGETTFIFRC